LNSALSRLFNDKPKLFLSFKRLTNAKRQWLMPVILATQEAEIRRITVRRQTGQIVWEKTHHKNRAGGVAQGEGPKFKLQYHKKERKKKEG
jgi:hypothetical protein